MLSLSSFRKLSSARRLISRNLDFRISISCSYHSGSQSLRLVKRTLKAVKLLSDPESTELYRSLIQVERKALRTRALVNKPNETNYFDARLHRVWDSIIRSQHVSPEFDPVKQLIIQGDNATATDLFSLHTVYWYHESSRSECLACLSKLVVYFDDPFQVKPYLKDLIMHSFLAEQVRQFISLHAVLTGDSDIQPRSARNFACSLIDSHTDSVRFRNVISNILTTMAISCCTPLVGASVCLRFLTSGVYITNQTWHHVLTSLTIENPLRDAFHLKTISVLLGHLLKHHPDDAKEILSGDLKRKIMALGIRTAKTHSSPNIAYEIFQQISTPELGIPVPLLSCYDLICLHFSHEFVREASIIWLYVTKHYIYKDIISVDTPILIFLILRMSKFRKTIVGARKIAEAMAAESYKLEGVTEALLIYCARDRNIELAHKIYSHLVAPFRRSVLSALLKLHLSCDDEEGANRIISHIEKTDQLSPEDFTNIAEHLGTIEPKKGANYILQNKDKYDTETLHKALGVLISHFNSPEIEQKYMKDLLNSSSLDIRRLACSIILSRLCHAGKMQIARRFWQRWALKEDIQVRESRILLNAMLHASLYVRSITIFPWLCWRFRDLGVGALEVERIIKDSGRLTDKQRSEKISVLKSIYNEPL